MTGTDSKIFTEYIRLVRQGDKYVIIGFLIPRTEITFLLVEVVAVAVVATSRTFGETRLRSSPALNITDLNVSPLYNEESKLFTVGYNYY